ncbi:formylglycine-generating enzyme family protein [Lacipirellula parvula]|uniref:Sulfatase-modifying factor enzyme-like domain-containing protein n=1 Tax=Lacipirellula parvula TaxID=2650471 RepID=A0A5K7XB75_9BACT|nr:SUMF1/EgtB/PvdO family nonheme iron enzyme [Lacipirellula parvula]BBO32081.1 hypothetical protein PLANPX_1693 [Lacipirellula parvula]
MMDSDRRMRFSIVAITFWIAGGAAQAVDIHWVTVGNPGNFGGPETYGRVFGSVAYAYEIGRFEVTNGQYAEFLNSKDPAGTNSLSLYHASMASDANGGILLNASAALGAKFETKPGYQSHPVNFVSWFDAARFANWLNNGQGDADTETGAYTLEGGLATPTNAKTVTRNSGALIALPSEDEWYKAAYFDPDKGGQPGYWTYPTKSDAPPTSSFPTAVPNSANIIGNGFALTPGQGSSGSDIVAGVDYLTDVGAYSASVSAMGTFDQAGSLWEWNESIMNMPGGSAGVRGNMGGSFYNSANLTTNLGWAASNAYVQEAGLGFRLIRLQPLVGDFNGDGVVDSLDLTDPEMGWKARFGVDLDGEDFLAWQRNCSPAPAASTAEANTVPEPQSWSLAIVPALLLGGRRGWRRFTAAMHRALIGGIRTSIAWATATIGILAAAPASGVTIDWTPVGDVGNYDGPVTLNGNTYGGVDYFYSIGKYEVTNNQYVEFLNAKDPLGVNPFDLYNANMTSHATGGILFNASGEPGAKYSAKATSGNHPVNYVSWFDSLRFINWLNNGQGNADTETGAYTLLGGTPTPSNARTIERNPGAVIALPSEDEWYKAAYYDPKKSGGPGYWLYPTQSDQTPLSAPPSATPNSANIRGDGFALTPGEGTGGTDIKPTVDYLTDVGAYTGSPSYYGTFDQAGNVIEWHEQYLMPWSTSPAGVRGVRGAAFHNEESFANSMGGAASTASVQSVGQGFRVVNLAAITLPGDFNGDGFVDGADLTDPTLGWAARFGIDLDGQAFLTWQRSYQLAPPAAAAVVGAVVPEPSGLPLVSIIVAGGTALLRPFARASRVNRTTA